MQAMII